MNDENKKDEIKKNFAEKYSKYKNTQSFSIVIWLLSMISIGVTLYRMDVLSEYKKLLTEVTVDIKDSISEQKKDKSTPVQKPIQIRLTPAEKPNQIRLTPAKKKTPAKANTPVRKKTYKTSFSTSEELKKFESEIAGLTPAQQEVLRLTMEWLCRYEELVRAREQNNETERRKAEIQMDRLRDKIKSRDMTAWETGNFDIGIDVVKDVKAGKERNYNFIRKELVQRYLKTVELKKDYQTGLNLKVWTGWHASSWTSDFFDYPSPLYSQTGYKRTKYMFDPTGLIRGLYRKRLERLTACYKGYIYVMKSGEYKFELYHPTVPARWSCGSYAVYIDDQEKVKVIHSGYNPEDNKTRSFSMFLKRGFHTFMLINEINWRKPPASNIRLGVCNLNDNSKVILTPNDFFIKKNNEGINKTEIQHFY